MLLLGAWIKVSHRNVAPDITANLNGRSLLVYRFTKIGGSVMLPFPFDAGGCNFGMKPTRREEFDYCLQHLLGWFAQIFGHAEYRMKAILFLDPLS